MAGDVEWPGRGPTWLGVPALLIAVIGGLILITITSQQSVSRQLLTEGVATDAHSVTMNVYPNKGTPIVGEIFVEFRDGRNRVVRGQLWDFDDDVPDGLPEGENLPAPTGARYAAPLAIAYDPADPTLVLAVSDAHRWLADHRTPRIGGGMLAGGAVLTLVALCLLTRDARRRGLSWWQWYTAAPPPLDDSRS